MYGCVRETDPSPVRPQQAWTCHECAVMESSVRHWEISATVMECFTSCLLARTRTAAFFRSYVEKRGDGLNTHTLLEKKNSKLSRVSKNMSST